MQQRNSGKNQPVIIGIVATVCIVVYAAAMVQAAIRIYISADQHRAIAEREFFDIADLASAAGVLGFMNEAFVETVDDALAASATLEALIISGPEGEYAFERERGQAVNWVNNSPRFKHRLDFSRQSLYRPLRMGLRNVNIQAAASAVDYRLLSGILKETLLMVLTALALAFITLITEALSGKPAERRQYPQTDNARAEPEAVRRGEQNPNAPPHAESEQRNAETAAAPPEGAPQGGDPKGLYSPHGNIGWEEYTADRLDSELHRCAASEQDLACIMIEYKFAENLGGAFYNRFADDAVRFFSNRDLIFEKGERGITVICPQLDLERGFAKCDEFHNRVMEKFARSFAAKTDLSIGLSSRAGRLIKARRLMVEASEALERALADPVSHIVAFKSDPEKYRAFIAAQKKRRL